MLFAIDSDEHFVDKEGIAIAPMLSFQPSGIETAKLDAPEPDRFSGYSDAPFCEQIFDIAVAVTTRLRLNLK